MPYLDYLKNPLPYPIGQRPAAAHSLQILPITIQKREATISEKGPPEKPRAICAAKPNIVMSTKDNLWQFNMEVKYVKQYARSGYHVN